MKEKKKRKNIIKICLIERK